MRRACALSVALIAAAGCEHAPAADLRPWLAEPPEGPTWYAASRVLDLTGDGVADSVVLRAFGERSDSLHVVLSFYVGGEEAFREGWGSDYELIDPPWGDTVAVAVVDSFMRGRLDEVLRTVEVTSIGSALSEGVDYVPSDQPVEDDAANMVASAFQYAAARIDWKRVPGDSVSAVIERVDQSPYDTAEVQAVMRDIRNHTRAGVMVSYGYETVMSLAWSNRARRFFVLWSCC